MRVRAERLSLRAAAPTRHASAAFVRPCTAWSQSRRARVLEREAEGQRRAVRALDSLPCRRGEGQGGGTNRRLCLLPVALPQALEKLRQNFQQLPRPIVSILSIVHEHDLSVADASESRSDSIRSP